MKWSERVVQSGVGDSSVITQAYTATILVSLTDAGPGGWTLAGRADITSTFTSDFVGNRITIQGAPCKVHYTDDASNSGTVDVEGGLEARDGFYQFHVDVPGLDGGSNNTVRDDSPCGGPNDLETTEWSVAPTTPGGNGDLIDPLHISGSSSQPREGGEDTITWSFTLPG